MRELIPWLPLGLLFFLAFFDPRRPLRLLHLDLLIMLASSAYALVIWDGASGNNFTAMVLVDLGFVYLIVRMLSLVSRQRRTSDRIIPVLSVRSITVLLVLLVTVRLVYPLFDDRPVIDVGLASVIGADRITHGQELYDGAWGVLNHPDTYGPLTYLAYVPFEQIFPYSSPHRVLAARAAAAAWDLLTILGLIVLGRRLRTGPEGRALGIALAFAWASYPCTSFVLLRGFNDSLVALLFVGTLLVLSSPVGRGLFTALGFAAKFVAGMLVPLFGTLDRDRLLQSSLLFAVTFSAVTALAFGPFLPDGGVRELYDHTLGYQATRPAGFSLWGERPSLDVLELPLRIAAAALAIVVAIWPKRRTAVDVAALSAAVVLALELSLRSWIPSYAVWFAPFVFVALLAPRRT